MTTKRITLLAALSSGLEYYDFAIYAMLANYIAHQFFSSSHPYAGMMQTFLLFAVGYFIRPLGGIIFGFLGDRLGRKKSFLFSVLLMSFSTLLLGCMPTYSSIGLLAPVLFTILRIVQGIAFGAELPASLTFLTEHASNENRGLHCALMISGVGLGIAFGSLINYLVSILLTPEEMTIWGWRIPFIIGGVLAVVGYFIRQKAKETPYFLKAAKIETPSITKLIWCNRGTILKGMGMIIFPACFIIFVLMMPPYLHKNFNYPPQSIYLVITLGYLWCSLLIPFFGWLSDKVERRKLLCSVALSMIILSYFLFKILLFKTFLSLVFFIIIYQTICAAMAANYFVMLAESFPTALRFTGIAICYNVTYAIASLLPLIVESLSKVSGNNLIVMLFISLASITAMSAFKSKNLMQEE